MTAFEARPNSRAARSGQRVLQLKTQPLPVRSMSSLAIVRDLVKKVLQARKNLKTRYPDEDDDDPD
jgi:hypothetical protein